MNNVRKSVVKKINELVSNIYHLSLDESNEHLLDSKYRELESYIEKKEMRESEFEECGRLQSLYDIRNYEELKKHIDVEY